MIERAVRWHDGVHPRRYRSLGVFLRRLRAVSGGIEVSHDEHPLQLHWIDRGSDVTLVMFSAAVSSKLETVPAFSGKRTTEHLTANVLMVSDPSLLLDRELTLAWYAGNYRWPSLQTDLTKIILSLAGRGRIVLFGASGGGFAALEQSARLPGATVLAVNPQTDTNRYLPWAVERYDRAAWGIDGRERQPYRSTVVPQFSKPVDANVIYVQNSGDVYHVKNHWRPFEAALHPDNRVLLLDPDLGQGHVGPGSDSYRRLFETVTAHRDWPELRAACSQLELTSS